MRLSTSAHALLHDLAVRAQRTLSETIERYLAAAATTPIRQDTPSKTAKTRAKPTAAHLAPQKVVPAATAPQKQGPAFLTTKKGLCSLTITIGRHNFAIMRIRHSTIDAQDKRDMRRLHPDITFDWKKIIRQLAEKREVCRQYRSRRRTTRVPREREPFSDVVDPVARTVSVHDPDNIMGVGALLDSLLSRGLERLRHGQQQSSPRPHCVAPHLLYDPRAPGELIP